MDTFYAQVGIGILAVVLILEKVVAAVQKLRRNGGHADAGSLSPEFWRDTNKKLTMESLDATVVPILRQQTDILSRIESRSSVSHELHLKHTYMLESVEKSLERLRATNHAILGNTQRLLGGRLSSVDEGSE